MGRSMKKVLIETLWNVKSYLPDSYIMNGTVLIETLWNVKQVNFLNFSFPAAY